MKFLRHFNENLEISDIEQVIEHVEYCFYDLIDLNFKVEITPLHSVYKNNKSLYPGTAHRQEIRNWNIDRFDTIKIHIYQVNPRNEEINKVFSSEHREDIMSCLENATNYLSREWSGAYLTRVEYEKPVTVQKVSHPSTAIDADWFWSGNSFYSMTFFIEKGNKVLP